MTLNAEWRPRVDAWYKELRRQLYRPLETLELAGFVTTEKLRADVAARGTFAPMPQGTAWGGKWEYGWFRTTVTLGAEAAGERIVVRLAPGGEGLVFVNGVAAGAIDRWHTEITLTTEARPGQTYELLMETYAGHGLTPGSPGPVAIDRDSIPEPPACQRTVGECSVGVWEEDIYQLLLDVQTLLELRDALDPDSLRVARIDRGLKDFTAIADLERPRDEKLATIRAARDRLQPLLACRNGDTAPSMVAFGHAHLDVAWLWPLAETERKVARTLSNQLALFAEYPEHKFLFCQPHLWWMLHRDDPALYAEAVKAVDAGNIIPDGGMWVEADTNVTGGESLIRQILHGKRFFRETFGVDSELLWLPDVFGYSGALPQIMRGCGLRYFSTQKIFWNLHGGETFPYIDFTWEGIDGSEVRVHLHNDYNATTNPAQTIRRWRERVQKDDIDARLFPFGWGDGGGGPHRDHLEFLRRQADLEGCPRMRIDTPTAFFKALDAQAPPPNRYVGELYFQLHRGTYTTQARTKRGNRRSEFALREAELWSAAAAALNGFALPVETMTEAWREVLLNQFHDIIPGSSIARVYEEAEAAYGRVIATAGRVASDARMTFVASATDQLTVFNSLSWPRCELLPLPSGAAGATDEAGHALAVQQVEGTTLAEVAVPSCGWTTIRVSPTRAEMTGDSLIAEPTRLENNLLRVTLGERGQITSVLDKVARRELTAGPCNEMRMYKDVPSAWDAWDIDSMYALTPVPLSEPATIEVVAAGPLMAAVRVRRTLHDSPMTQVIRLRRDSRRVDFETVVDWQERHKMLKVAFCVDVHANEALHEIQFGHLRRPNHLSRPFDADRFEVCNHKWSALVEEGRGVAVLNDCKYGLNVLGKTIHLTLLRSSIAPDMTADRGRQEFTYSLHAWEGSFVDSDVIRQAYELNCPLTIAAGAAEGRSLFSLNADNVVVETIKPAEDGAGDVIVRLYESRRTATRCTLTTTLPVSAAQQTDMLETPQADLPVADGRIGLDFRPFEIKTLRLRR